MPLVPTKLPGYPVLAKFRLSACPGQAPLELVGHPLKRNLLGSQICTPFEFNSPKLETNTSGRLLFTKHIGAGLATAGTTVPGSREEVRTLSKVEKMCKKRLKITKIYPALAGACCADKSAIIPTPPEGLAMSV